MTNEQVQKIAKTAMDFIKSVIRVGMSLRELKEIAEMKMIELGATSFWYWNIGAFIFSGDETSYSVSGKKYRVSDNTVFKDDIVTIDLSPQAGKIWGDYARTVIIENGAVIEDIDKIENEEWRNGLLMEEKLHKELLAFAHPKKTFDELYRHMNKIIDDSGYVNLDFKGNLGHTIEEKKRRRIYIEKGNSTLLGEADYFTFEPHVALKNSKYGFKKENIYYFHEGVLREL